MFISRHFTKQTCHSRVGVSVLLYSPSSLLIGSSSPSLLLNHVLSPDSLQNKHAIAVLVFGSSVLTLVTTHWLIDTIVIIEPCLSLDTSQNKHAIAVLAFRFFCTHPRHYSLAHRHHHYY